MKPKKQTVPAVNPATLKRQLKTLSAVADALYEQAEEMGGGMLADHLESLAREINAACAGMEAVNPAALAAVSTHDLIAELGRRQNEVTFIAVTPSDLSDYWGTDDNGDPLPTNKLPCADAWNMARRAFDRWQDCGAFAELMEVMGDAWAEHQKRKGESK